MVFTSSSARVTVSVLTQLPLKRMFSLPSDTVVEKSDAEVNPSPCYPPWLVKVLLLPHDILTSQAWSCCSPPGSTLSLVHNLLLFFFFFPGKTLPTVFQLTDLFFINVQ